MTCLSLLWKKRRQSGGNLSSYLIATFLATVWMIFWSIQNLNRNGYLSNNNFMIESIKFLPTSTGRQNRPVTKSMSGSNLTLLSDSILMFNRVPKCGSEMLVLLMQWLQANNGFRHIRLGNNTRRRLNRMEQLDVVDEVMGKVKSAGVRMSFDRHVYFINFTSHGAPQSPTYVNIIRDPIEKAISRFYYRRVTAKGVKQADLSQMVWDDFEECYQSGDPECSFQEGNYYDLTIPYFCGHNKWCMLLNDEWAVEEAKQRVEKYYPVVGVLEELNATLTTLQYRIPAFFSGIVSTYFDMLHKPHWNKNRMQKPKLSNRLVDELKEKLKMEYEFYYWVKRRLLSQYKGINHGMKLHVNY